MLFSCVTGILQRSKTRMKKERNHNFEGRKVIYNYPVSRRITHTRVFFGMKSGHRATFADEEVLSEYNCSKESIPLSESPNNNTNNTVDILKNRNGWEFCSHHCTILNEMENICLTENIKKSLADRLPSLRSNGPAWLVGDSLEINECKLHTPPMLFGRDFIEIRTGRSVLSLNACDAILCWAAQVSK